MPQPVLTDMNPRLRAAAVEVADTREKHRAAMELRNQLVVADTRVTVTPSTTACPSGPWPRPPG
jgi:hypothetical protein